MCKPSSFALVVAAAWLLASGVCHAHKINVFAAVEGGTIQGQAYVRGGTPVEGATVRITAPSGETLFAGQTDAAGKFRYTALRRVDHRLTIDLGDGHSESYVVRAAELPAQLPGGDTAPTSSTSVASVPEARPAPGPAGEGASLEAQLAQLRRELEAFRNETRWHDVLGGIGYILGLMGLAFYFLGTRRHTPSK